MTLNAGVNQAGPDFQNMYMLTASVNLPVYFQTKQEPAVKEATASVSEAKHDLEATKLMLASTLRDNYSMMRSAEKLLDLYENALIPKSTQDYQLALSGYGAGKIEALTVISRLKSFLDVELLYWNQFVEREKALARITAITGNGIPELKGNGQRTHRHVMTCPWVKRDERPVMKKKYWIVTGVAAVLVLLAVAAIFYLKGIPSPPVGTEKVAVSKTDSGPAPAAEHQGHAPGSMPGMPGMAPQGEPEKKAAEAPAETPAVEITSEKQQLIGVKIATVSVRPLSKVIRTVGRIEYDETHAQDGEHEGRRVDRKALYRLYGPVREKRGAHGRALQPGAACDPGRVSEYLEMAQGEGDRNPNGCNDLEQTPRPSSRRQRRDCSATTSRRSRSGSSSRRGKPGGP